MKKILIIEANPNVDLKLNDEIKVLKKVIEKSPDREKFQIEDGLSVQSTELQELMHQHKPAIVHFCGHGMGENGLLFRDKKIDTDTLSRLFESCQYYLQCVVLNACYSEVQANEIVKYIPYVIGINKNETIADKAAIAFSIGFYRALGYGRSFQYAYRCGCKAIQLAISDDSLNRDAIAENMRKLIPINDISEASITQEHLKPIFKKKSMIHPDKLEDLEEHYDSLITAIKRVRMIPFLGSDINLCDRPIEGNGELESWEPDSPYPPSGKELAIYLAEKFPPPPPVPVKMITCPLCEKDTERIPGKVPKECPLTLHANTILVSPQSSESLIVRGEPLEYLSQYAYLENQSDFYEQLQKLNLGSQPNRLHKFFATLPSIMRKKGYYQEKKLEYPLIITSNYDCALERAFEEAKEPFDLVFYSNAVGAEKEDRFVHRKPEGEGRFHFHKIKNPNEYNDLSFKERTVILKLYGSVDQIEEGKTLVITEENFIEYFVSREISNLLPQQIRRKIQFPQPNILFLGYTLGNWNQRIILHRIWRSLGLKKDSWWAIQPHPEEFAQKLWDSYHVNLYDINLRDYIIELEQRVRDISDKGQRS